MSKPIRTFRVNQNNQGFLLGIFPMSELKTFVRFTEHIVLDYDEETNRPIYNEEVQRKISPSKVDAIADFLIHDTDAFFPTNIVVSIPSIAIEKLEELGDTTIIYLNDIVETENRKDDGDRYLTIIDGQHRVAGIEKAIRRINDDIKNRSSSNHEKFKAEIAELSNLRKRLEAFEIVVTFFIDPTPEYQAMVFSTINRTQTKVSEDLVFSLFGLSKTDSPQKTSLEVMLALNASKISPLYNRIKLSGANYKNRVTPPLSQRAAVKRILYQISPNLKQAEIEKNKPRKYVLDHPTGGIFRKYYGNNEDYKIITIINEFFKAVRDVYVYDGVNSYWDLDAPFNILHTTVGYQAFFSIMVDLVRITTDEKLKLDFGYYKSKLLLAKDLDVLDDNNPKQYPLTSKSINLIYNYVGERVLGNLFVRKDIND